MIWCFVSILFGWNFGSFQLYHALNFVFILLSHTIHLVGASIPIVTVVKLASQRVW